MSIRLLTLSLVALALLGCGDNSMKAAPPGTTRIHCVNPASNYVWDIALDETGAKADGRPARFDGAHVSWSDPTDGSVYEFDRSSGQLTYTRASSTGGAINFYRCVAAR